MQTTDKPTARFCTYGGADLITIRAEQLGEYWPAILKFLAMVDSPDWTTDQVYESILSKKAQVWAMVEQEITGIWITRIEIGRELTALVWIAAGSGLEKGLSLFLSETESWFRELGCKEVRLLGRRGWKKVLPDYEESRIELRKKL